MKIRRTPDKFARPGFMKSLACTAAIILTSFACYAQSTDGKGFLVDLAVDNKISIRANNASLRDLLLEVQSQTGIKVNFVADPTARVTVDIADAKIENAINKLWPNHMVIHGMRDGKPAINELIIISDEKGTTGGTNSQFLPGGGPAPEVFNPEEPPLEDINDIPALADQPPPDGPAPAPVPTN